MGLYSGEGGWGLLIFGRKDTKHFTLQSVKLFFLFSSIKHIFWHFPRRARCEICSKLTVKTPEYLKLTIKLKIKTPLTWLKKKKNISFLFTVFLLLTVNCRLRFYIWDVNWVTHLGVVYSGRGGCINGILR